MIGRGLRPRAIQASRVKECARCRRAWPIRQPSGRDEAVRHAAEDVLCVPRSTIFPDGAWHGLIARGLERVLRTVHATVGVPAAGGDRGRRRSSSRSSRTASCTIPHDDSYLLTRRLRRSSEKRLHHLYSLGIGGHVNPGDGERDDPVVGGLRREWAEEIRCPWPARASLVALLNDDSSAGLAGASRPGVPRRAAGRPGRGARGREARGRDPLARGDAAALSRAWSRWSQLVFDDLVAGARTRVAKSPLIVDLEPAP